MTDINNIYKFEDYVLNPARRELKLGGSTVELEPRAFDVLVFLIENRNRAVDKSELQDAIWPGMFVTETALTRAVMKARKAIGDDASQQRMIKTLHGHGYRFIARLTSQEADEIVQPSPVPTELNAKAEVSEVQARVKLNIPAIALVGIAAVMISILVWVFLRPERIQGDEVRMAVLPLIDNTQNPELAWTGFGLMSYASKLLGGDDLMAMVTVGSTIALAENLGWTGDLSDPANYELLDRLRVVYGATHILSMELESEGGALRMNYSLLLPGGEQQMGTIVGDGATDLTDGVVQAIYGNMFRKSHVGGDVPLVSKDSFNNEAFARGMDLSVQGRCTEAVKFFRVIIEQEPSLVAPRYELAACLRILGEAEEAEPLLISLIEEQKPMGPSRQLAESMMTLGILYNRTGRLDSAESVYSEALAISEELKEYVLEARVLQNLSILAKSRSELEEAQRLLDLAMLAYQNAGIEVLPGQFYSGRANLSMARGQLVEAEGQLEQALQAFRDIGDRRMEAMMLNNTGYLRLRQGRLEEAEAYHLRSLDIREEIGDRVGVGRIYNMLSGVYSEQAKYADAIAAAKSAVNIARETKDRLFEATSLAQLAAAENAMGNVDAARQHYLESRDIFVEIQDKLRILQVDLKVAEIELTAGRFDEVELISRQVLMASRENDILSSQVEALELLGDLAHEREDNAAATQEYKNALTVLQDSTWASKKNAVRIKLANAYMNDSEVEAAAPLIGQIAAASANVQSLETQARFAFMRDEPEKAVSLMIKAKELAGDLWSDNDEATLKTYQQNLTP